MRRAPATPATSRAVSSEREPRPFAGQLAQQREQLLALVGRRHHARLVDQQHARLAHERLRERDARLVRRRELVRERAGAVRRADAFERLVRLGVRRHERPALGEQRQRDVVEHRLAARDAPRLRREADGAQPARAGRARAACRAPRRRAARRRRRAPRCPPRSAAASSCRPAAGRGSRRARPATARSVTSSSTPRRARGRPGGSARRDRTRARASRSSGASAGACTASPLPVMRRLSSAARGTASPRTRIQKCFCLSRVMKNAVRRQPEGGAPPGPVAIDTRDLNVRKADYRKSDRSAKIAARWRCVGFAAGRSHDRPPRVPSRPESPIWARHDRPSRTRSGPGDPVPPRSRRGRSCALRAAAVGRAILRGRAWPSSRPTATC